MTGVGCRAVALFGIALGAGCGAQPAPATAVVEASAATEPVYRFVSLGVTSPMNQLALEGGRIGVITDDGGREIVEPDGSLQIDSARSSNRLLGGVPVPARLGGGFLFWDDALYLARSFTAPLEAITGLPTNAVGVEFGPDYLLLLAPESPPRAFALDPPRARPLSPRGVIDVAATDDGRALALDATGRAFASTDAGKSWQDVTAALSAPVSGVRDERNEVAFVSKNGGAWLQRDGRLVPRPLSPRATELRKDKKATELLRSAFSSGIALPGMRAWVGEGRGTVVLDLRSGGASPAVVAGPEGSRCVPVSLDEDGLVVCVRYSSPAATTVISHALAGPAVIEKTFAGTPQFMPGRTLSVTASCSGALAAGTACVRRSGGAWVELKASAEVLEKWQPLFWVPRERGGVDLIVSERDVRDGQPRVALLDPGANRVIPWDTTVEQVTPNSEASEPGTSFSVLADGSVRGYSRTGTFIVDPHGHLTAGARTFVAISSAGAHALARDSAEHLWQTSDYGARWLEIGRPPFDEASEGMAAKLNPRPSGRASRIDCSVSGCALEHSSGTGLWLRLGWPEDPARTPVESTPAQRAASEKGALAPPPIPEPVLPKLRCLPRAGAPLRVTAPARKPEPKASGEWLDLLWGKRALARRPPHSFENIAYRDLFSSANDYVRYGLRAAVHLETRAGTSSPGLVPTKTPLDVLFVEPFDPNGSVRQLSATPAAPKPSAAEEWGDREEREGAARPVLSHELGRAAGVLLVNGAHSYWASNKGDLQLLPAKCAAASGYVNARGKRFVACGDRNGSTRIEQLATPPEVIVRAPVAAHFRDRGSPGLHFFGPGEPVFLNPDAIAVGADGKLRILRLPPGDVPPTSDNPAWLLSADAAPVALAPWSTLEQATSPACASGDGQRAIVQTGKSWLDVAGASAGATRGMTALVRWSTERICLEAVEVGFSQLDPDQSRPISVSAVVRFVGAGPGAAFVGTESSAAVREPANCVFGNP